MLFGELPERKVLKGILSVSGTFCIYIGGDEEEVVIPSGIKEIRGRLRWKRNTHTLKM